MISTPAPGRPGRRSASSEETFHQTCQQVAIEGRGARAAPVVETPDGGIVFKAEEYRLAANLEVIEHLLVVGANFAFENIRDQELVRGKQFSWGLECDLH